MERKHQVFVCSVSAACNGTDLYIAPLFVQRIPQPFADHLHDNALSKGKQAHTTGRVGVAVT